MSHVSNNVENKDFVPHDADIENIAPNKFLGLKIIAKMLILTPPLVERKFYVHTNLILKSQSPDLRSEFSQFPSTLFEPVISS